MKIKNFLITSGLALAMGLGVGASLVLVNQTKEVKADPEITYKKYYFDVENPKDNNNYPWWLNNGAFTYMYAYYEEGNTKIENAPWPGQRMNSYSNYATFYLEVDSRLDKAIFNRVNPDNLNEVWNRTSWAEGGTSINLPNNDEEVQCFVLKSAFNGNYADGNAAGDWIQYEFEVDTYVKQLDDTIVAGHQTVMYGQYPEKPVIQYGTTFEGWWRDADREHWANPEGWDDVSYDKAYGFIHESRVYNTLTYDFTDAPEEVNITSSHRLKLHQENTAENEFYYINIDSSLQGSITVYEGTFITLDPEISIQIAENYNQVVGGTWYSSYCYDTLHIKKYTWGDDYSNYFLSWNSSYDIPPEDGYYIVNSNDSRFDHMKHDDARITQYYKLESYNQDGFVAVYRNYHASKDENIIVRSYFNHEDHYHSLDNDSYDFQSPHPIYWTTEDTTYYSMSFRVAGSYDIYMRSNGTFHVELVDNTYGVVVRYSLFHPNYVGVDINYDYFIVQENEVFNPDLESEHDFDKDLFNDATGLLTGELYTDAQCTTKWTPAVLNNNITLYAKCYEDGAYLIGDASYTGSSATAWSLDAGKVFVEVGPGEEEFDQEHMIYYMDTYLQVEDVLIPSTTTAENPTQIATLLLLDMVGGYEGYLTSPIYCDFTLDGEYDFASIDNSVTNQMKLTLTRGGTFDVKAHVNIGLHLDSSGHPTGQMDLVVSIQLLQDDNSLDTFLTNFLSSIGGVCKTDNTTDLEALAVAWGQQKTAYLALSETNQNIIKAVGFNGGNENGNKVAQVVAKYAYIINRYGSDAFEDFIFNGVHSSPKVGFNQANVKNNVVIIAVLVSSALLFTVGLKFFCMKKKEQ